MLVLASRIREAVSAPHLPPGHYPGTCLDLTAAQIAEREASGKPPAVRLRTEQPSVIVDRLHGEHTEVIDDVVLRRRRHPRVQPCRGRR